MGGNGSKASGSLENEAGRRWTTVLSIGDNIKVLENKNPRTNVKLPEESHSPNHIYVVVNKPPQGEKGKNDPFAGKLKSIGVYGPDSKKRYEIHVDHAHDGLSIHYHPWKDGKPIRKGEGKNSPNVAYALTEEMQTLLNLVKNMYHIMKNRKYESESDYIGHDLFGYEYNQKFPPNKSMYGDDFGGYASPNKETFFYDFCILHYGVAFSYHGEDFEVKFTNDGPVLHNLTIKSVQGPFDNPIALIEQGKIGCHNLIDLLDNLEYVVIH